MSRRPAALACLLLSACLLPAGAQQPHPVQRPALPPATPDARPEPATPPVAKPEPVIDESHLALAREAMRNSGIARSFDAIVPAIGDQIKKKAITRPELTKDLEEVLAGIQPEMDEQKRQAIDAAARIYAKALTEPELTQVVAFFRSPAGRRYVATQPQLLDELVGEMQDWTQDVSELMTRRVREEMEKRGRKLP